MTTDRYILDLGLIISFALSMPVFAELLRINASSLQIIGGCLVPWVVVWAIIFLLQKRKEKQEAIPPD